MSRPSHRWLTFALSLAAVAIATLPLRAAEPQLAAAGDKTLVDVRRPNVVLIMADDLGWSDIGCYGGDVRTPNIDRLAAEGLRFSAFYNNAKCTTTRASLTTGLYPRPADGLLTENMVTLGEAMRMAGYQTSLSGKWHLGATPGKRPFDRGFDEYYGLMDGCCNYFDPARPDPGFKDNKVRVWGHNDQIVHDFPEGFYSTDAIADHAVAQIDRFSGTSRPFFVHVCFTAPHYPLHAKAQDMARYQGQYMMGWEKLRLARHERQIASGLIDPKWPLPGRDHEVIAWAEEPNQAWQDQRMAAYAAMVDCMDQGIGRILSALDRADATQDTLVMFLADNGGCAEEPGGEDVTAVPGDIEYYTAVGPDWAWAQNTPFRRYKAFVHEGGISTPCVARWPARIEAGRTDHQVAHIIDIMPTLLEIGGGHYPTEYNGHAIMPVEGVSLTTIFDGRQRAPRQSLYWEWGGNRAVRQGDWKLVWEARLSRWELYDLAADRTEMNDLAKAHPARVDQMSRAWLAWADRTGVKLNKNKKSSAD